MSAMRPRPSTARRRSSGSLEYRSSRKRSPCAGSPIRLREAEHARAELPATVLLEHLAQGGPRVPDAQHPDRLERPVAHGRRAVGQEGDERLAVLGRADLAERGRRRGSDVGLGVLEGRHQVRDRAASAEDADGVGRLRPDARLLVPQASREAPEHRRVHGGEGRQRGAIVLVGEGLQEGVDRAVAVALGVDLHDRPDGLFADARVAVLQRGHESGDAGEIAQRAQGRDHREPHLDLGVAHEGGDRSHRLAAPALAELRDRHLAGPGGRALQVGEEVLVRLLGRRGGHAPPRETERESRYRPGTQAADHGVKGESQHCHDA